MSSKPTSTSSSTPLISNSRTSRRRVTSLAVVLRQYRRGIRRSINKILCLLAVFVIMVAPFRPALASPILSTNSPLGPVNELVGLDATSQLQSQAQELKQLYNQPDSSTHNEKSDFGSLPLRFEPNMGQSDPSARFLTRVPGGTLFFTPSGIVAALALKSSSKTAEEPSQNANSRMGGDPGQVNSSSALDPIMVRIVHMNFVGAKSDQSVLIQGEDKLVSKSNYFMGANPSAWHTEIPNYSALTYSNLYPGVNLRYDNARGQLKGSYIVAPGADPTQIRWRYDGAEHVSVDALGNLQVRLTSSASSNKSSSPTPTVSPIQGASGTQETPSPASDVITITEQAPLSWQLISGRKVMVTTLYKVAKDGTISFELSSFDKSQQLIIDPDIIYSTYFGGSGGEDAYGVALDKDSNAYITGLTGSTDFPLQNPYQSTFGSLFISKLDTTGTTLLYSTYISGGQGHGIAVDSSANIYVTGRAGSGLPTVNAYQSTYGGNGDAFLTKLNSSGSALVFSTYLGGGGLTGGGGSEYGHGIALDSAGNAYIVGETSSTNFPTYNPYQSTLRGGRDAFVAKFSSSGTLAYSTYLGGSIEAGIYPGSDEGNDIAVDGSGHAYVTGHTSSDDFPVENAFQSSDGGAHSNAFVTKFSADGTELDYSTYLGGSLGNNGEAIAVDLNGNAIVGGTTNSSDFPVENALQPTLAGDDDAFITKFSADGSELIFSTYMGGSGSDLIQAGKVIGIDAAGNVYATGHTTSNDFPLVNPYQSTKGGGEDAIMFTLDASGSELLYSTYLGGSDFDMAYSIAVGPLGEAVITGETISSNFPLVNALDTDPHEIFITKFESNVRPRVDEMRCGGSPSQRFSAESVGNLVNSATGYFCTSGLDMQIPGRGASLAFYRTYNADMAAITSTLGYGWTHNYNMWVERDAQNNYRVHEENGSIAPFASDFTHPLRVMATLTQTNAGSPLIFTRSHGQDAYYFKPLTDTLTPGKLYKIVDRNNYTTTLSYNGSGQLQTVTDPGSRTLTLNYTSGLLTSVVDNAGSRTASFGYNVGASTFLTATDIGGQKTYFSYDGNHLLQTIKDPNNGILTTEYYGDRRTKKQTDPESRFLQFGYSAAITSTNITTRITDTLGLITAYDYTNYLLQKVTQYPGAHQATWTYTYQANTPWVASVTDPLTHTWKSTWDVNGNKISSTDPLTRTMLYAYDLSNNLTVVTDTAQVTTTFAYDDPLTGNLLSTTRPLTQTGELARTRYTYDPSHPGDVLTVTNELTKSWGLRYDSYGSPASTINPLAETAYSRYDSVGRLLVMTDAMGYATKYDNNVYGNVITVTNPLTKTTVYTYDNKQNVKTVKDAKGQIGITPI